MGLLVGKSGVSGGRWSVVGARPQECERAAPRSVKVEYGAGWDASLTTRTYCFRIPRSGSSPDAGAELQRLDC